MSLTIKQRLCVGLVTVIVFATLLAGGTLLVQERLGESMNNLERQSEKRALIADLQLGVEKLLMPANDYIITGHAGYADEFQLLSQEVEKTFSAIRSSGDFNKEEMKSVDKSFALFVQVKKAGEAILSIHHRDPRQPDLMETMDYVYAAPIIMELNDLSGRVKLSLVNAQRQAKELRQISRVVVMSAVLIMTLLIAATGIHQYRSISHSLDSLIDILREIAEGKGDLTKRIKVKSRDEFGMLGEYFNKFADQVQAMMLEVRVASREVSASAQSVATASRDTHQVAGKQLVAVERTTQATELLNASITGINDEAEQLLDLSSSAASSSAEISASITSVAGLTENLDHAADATLSSVNEINASFRQVAQSITELSERADSVVASAIEINAVAKSISNHAHDQAEMAGEIMDEAVSIGLETVKKTRERMEKIRSEVAATAEVMDRLGATSAKITRIVGMIDEITDKTKLLALNASILAAQAGIKGKGFGVVAEEVKALALQTANSTEEISAMVKHVQEGTATAISATGRSSREVEDGVRLSLEAEAVLSTIIGKTERSLQNAMKVARATEEQTTGVGVVTGAIQQIQQMIAKISRAVAEQRKASDEILAASEGIQVYTFETRDVMLAQSEETQRIATIVQEVYDKVRIIVDATIEQHRSSTEIVRELGVINLQAETNITLAAGLDEVVSTLEDQSRLLTSKIENFRI